jgi:hypothetical protein
MFYHNVLTPSAVLCLDFIKDKLNRIEQLTHGPIHILVPLKILYIPLMLLRSRQCIKSTQVAALIGLRVFLAGIQAVFTGF